MHKQEAVFYANVSMLAYEMLPAVDGFQLTARFENKGTDTQGIFGTTGGDTFVIAFRGSEETGIADWITDLKFVKQVYPFEGGNKKSKVHYGFIQAYKSVRDAVLNAARNTPHKNIVCTGHSLGAALATLAALDIRLNVPGKNVRCFTFGSPKVGNKAFVESYNSRVPETFRFVNRSDLIPSLPPGAFQHVGRLFHLGEETAKRSLKEIAKRMEDHFPYKYVEMLKELLD